MSKSYQRFESSPDDCGSADDECRFRSELDQAGPAGLQDWRRMNSMRGQPGAESGDVYIDQGGGAPVQNGDFVGPRMARGQQFGPVDPREDLYAYDGYDRMARRPPPMPDYIDQYGPHWVDPRDPNAFRNGDPSVDLRGIGNRDSTFIRPWTPEELQAYNNAQAPRQQLSLNLPNGGDLYGYTGGDTTNGAITQQGADRQAAAGAQQQGDGPFIPMWMRFAPGGPAAYLPEPKQEQKKPDGQKTEQQKAEEAAALQQQQLEAQQKAAADKAKKDAAARNGTPEQTEQTLAATPTATPISADPNAYFMTQFRSQFNPNGPAVSENCGPTSLAMAFKAFGKGPAEQQGNTEGLIEQTRVLMTGNNDINSETTYSQLVGGAKAGGLNAQVVPGIEGVDQALQQGAMVIAAGNPGRDNAYGERLSESEYSHFNGRHLVLVVGRSGDNYLVNDPLSRKGTIAVSRAELQTYISDPNQPAGNGGVAVWA